MLTTFQKSNELGHPGQTMKKISVVGDDDLRSYSSTKKIVATAGNNKTPAYLYGNVPLTFIMRRKVDSVDIKSLRTINMELLKSMRANTKSSGMSLFLTTGAELLTTDKPSRFSYGDLDGLGKILTPATFKTSST